MDRIRFPIMSLSNKNSPIVVQDTVVERKWENIIIKFNFF